MTNIDLGALFPRSSVVGPSHETGVARIDGELDTWTQLLLDTLLDLHPLPSGMEPIPTGRLHPSRVTLLEASELNTGHVPDRLVADKNYHTAVVSCNRRITAADWFQDVRHMEFTFQSDLQ
jgi:sulfite reductase alpha subunit-like flavoprotein